MQAPLGGVHLPPPQTQAPLGGGGGEVRAEQLLDDGEEPCTIESDADKAAGAERRREEATVAGEAAAGLRRGTRARRSTRDRTDAADEVFQRMVKGRR